MPIKPKEYDDHKIHQEMANLLSNITAIEDSMVLEGDDVLIINRLKQVHSYLNQNLSNSDPMMISMDTLNHLNSLLVNTNSHLNTYKQSPSTVHLQSANQNLDKILVSLPQIRLFTTPADINGLNDSITSFRRSIGQQLAREKKAFEALKTKHNELKSTQENLESSITQQKARLDTIITEFQDQSIKHEKERSEEYRNKEKGRDRIFNEEIEQYKHSFSNFKDTWDVKFEALLTKYNEAFNKTVEEFEPKKQDTLDKANKMLESIEKVRILPKISLELLQIRQFQDVFNF